MLGVCPKIPFIEQLSCFSFLMIPDFRKFVILVVRGGMIVTGERLSTVLDKMYVL
jgi:hypothetical protein